MKTFVLLGSGEFTLAMVDVDKYFLSLLPKNPASVAILTTPGFDATQVDILTVRFGPNQATEIHNKGHLEDVDGDGHTDMILHFKTQETGIQKTDTRACLTGTILNGVTIQGCDSVKIVDKQFIGCRKV